MANAYDSCSDIVTCDGNFGLNTNFHVPVLAVSAKRSFCFAVRLCRGISRM